MSVPVRKSVQLYYDVISPHSWIAFELLSRYQDSKDVDLQLMPFSVSELQHRSAPRSRPDSHKLGAICQDAEKLGKHYGVPLKAPKNLQDAICHKGSLPAMRLLTAISQTRPELTGEFSRSLWTRMWNKDEDIIQRKSLIQLGRDLGQSESLMENLLEKTKERSTACRLRSVTEEAMERGATDAPMIVLEDSDRQHVLSGSEKLPLLAKIIDEQD